jgi:glycosyltransferase involved in cell wall biosynthesis
MRWQVAAPASPREMRVLYVNQTAQVGGAEHSLLTLLCGLGNAVEPAVACPEGELAEMVREAGIEHWPIAGTQASFRLHPLHTTQGLFDMARSALAVRRLVKRLEPDLVHANTTRAALLALLARARSGPPVIAHIRDWVPEGRFSRVVLKTVARRADEIVANSAYVGGQFDGLGTRRPVRVVHNPVELSRFDPTSADGPAVRRELGFEPEAVVISMVATLTPWKGQDDAIAAFAMVDPAGRPPLVLVLAGSAKFAGAGTQYDNLAYERRLHAQVEEQGLVGRVRFLGERADVPDLLAASDLLLMPSWREAFGRIVIEAMAMGVPVLATDVGGPSEVVEPGVDGLLLPPRQPERWAEAIASLVDDRSLRESMGAAAAARARDFATEAHVARFLAIYGELIDPSN